MFRDCDYACFGIAITHRKYGVLALLRTEGWMKGRAGPANHRRAFDGTLSADDSGLARGSSDGIVHRS